MNLHNKAGSSVMGSFASVISLGLISKNEQRDKVKNNIKYIYNILFIKI